MEAVCNHSQTHLFLRFRQGLYRGHSPLRSGRLRWSITP
jgi:hypothetical protein